MSVFSIDLLIFIFYSVVFYKINHKGSIAVWLVKKVRSYIPPNDEDIKYVIPQKEDKKDKKEDKKDKKDEKTQEELGDVS